MSRLRPQPFELEARKGGFTRRSGTVVGGGLEELAGLVARAFLQSIFGDVEIRVAHSRGAQRRIAFPRRLGAHRLRRRLAEEKREDRAGPRRERLALGF